MLRKRTSRKRTSRKRTSRKRTSRKRSFGKGKEKGKQISGKSNLYDRSKDRSIDYDFLTKNFAQNSIEHVYMGILSLLPLTAIYLKNVPNVGFKAFKQAFTMSYNTMDEFTNMTFGLSFKKYFIGAFVIGRLVEIIWSVIVDKLGLKNYKDQVIRDQKFQRKYILPLLTATFLGGSIYAYIKTPDGMKEIEEGGARLNINFNKDCEGCVAHGDNNNDCLLCYDPLKEGTCIKLSCNHCFHESCIKNWFGVKNRAGQPLVCPLNDQGHA